METETVVSNFRLPGQYFDSETGLHYNVNRYYDPDTGRYLRTDPLGLEGGLNLYLYAMNNPLMAMDPDGLKLRQLKEVMLPEDNRPVHERASAYAAAIVDRRGLDQVPAVVVTSAVVTGATVAIVGAMNAPKLVLNVLRNPATKKSSFIEGGKKELANFLKNNVGQSKDVVTKRLLKSIKTHQKGITDHTQYLKDPTIKYGDKWKTMTPRHKSNAIHHWKKDIQRASDYIKVKQNYLNGL